MKFEEIHTTRLILRKINQEGYDHLFHGCTVNEIMHFLGLNSNEEFFEEERKYKNGLSTHNKKFLYFQLIEKETEKIIGWCGYHTWYIDHKRAEIGYGLFIDSFKNKGLMSEALSPILEYGFKKMKLNRIEAFIGPTNNPSIKLVSKFKFVKEGQLRAHYYKNDNAEDSLVYSLLSNEYKSKMIAD